MVNNYDIHNIGFDYYGYPHTRRKLLPFTDEELGVIALYMRTDNKRKLGNNVLQQMSDIDYNYIYSYGGNKAVNTSIKGGKQ